MSGLVAVLACAAALIWPWRPARVLAVPARPRGSAGRTGRWPLRRAMPDPAAGLLLVLEAVAAQVRGGAAPALAWDTTLDVLGATADHLPRARGEPLADVLRRHAGSPGHARRGGRAGQRGRAGQGGRAGPGGRTGRDGAALQCVAAALALADDVGAPLADVLDTLAAGLRAEADVDGEVEAALAAPRATARLLAVLPLVGVGLGQAIGAAPLRVLVLTGPGRVSAVGGLTLALVGVLWTRRLVARAAALA